MFKEMKITVCFGSTKIIVPCGSDLPVRDLVEKAIVRYRRVTNKHIDDCIRVHCLQTCDEGAILDEGDTVGDVLDDRDKVIASYEENLASRPGHNGGDGTSTSSVGTASPDIFQGEADTHCPEVSSLSDVLCSNKEISRKTSAESRFRNSSQVKYVDGFPPYGSHSTFYTPLNREDKENRSRLLEGRSSGSDMEGYDGNERGESDHDDDDDDALMSTFRREPARKSLKSDHLDRWINMQESYSDFKRHEPTGAPPSPIEKISVPDFKDKIARRLSTALSEPDDSEQINIILKPTMGENLGITVQGYKTADESELGLIVLKIDPKGCAARDGRIQVADRIVAVNNQDLTNVSNARAEEAFSKALQCDTIELTISRSHSFLPETQSTKNSAISLAGKISKDDDLVDGLTDAGKSTLVPLPNISAASYKKTLTSLEKNDVAISKVVEKKILIELQKGSDGLGFSVTSRDNPAGGACPIYVKNILPRGAAIRDGQLQAGDEILKVNDIEMTGKSHQEAVNILRSTKELVKLSIRRKVTVTSPLGSKKLIKDLERAPSDSRGNKILLFEIALPSSGTAGLGITVKGKSNISEQNESTGDDLGIFVKTIVPGGAANQDGRLRPNDQLISVNGVKLTGMSNSSAMKTLRSAMETKRFGSVEVTVIRSVKEIINNVSDLETVGEEKTCTDRAIDVGESRSERMDVPDGAMSGAKEYKSNHENFIHQESGVERKNVIGKPHEGRFLSYQRRPASDDELPRKTQRSVDQYPKYASDNELNERSRKHHRRGKKEEIKIVAKPVFGDFATDSKPKSNSGENVSKKRSKKIVKNEEKEKGDDEVSELKTSRNRSAKLANGVHRNPSYYIAMNRTGQRTERASKSKRSLTKSPFYHPRGTSNGATFENVNDEKPKIVIASYTDTARVSKCIANRPSSTVAEPTSAVSTAAPATLPRSSEAKKSRDISPLRENTWAKRPPASLNIPKGTPPPPPPRTSRPSPYMKQFPNYLSANTVVSRKSESAFSDYSETSDVSPTFQSPEDNSVNVISATEVKSGAKNTEKQIVLSAQSSTESNKEDIDYLTDDDDEEGTGERFVREGMGRQSMSEKRFKLAQADITQTEFYKQRVTRSRSLEGAKEQNVNMTLVNYESQTLPRLSNTSIENDQTCEPRDGYGERMIENSLSKARDRRKISEADILSLSALDQSHLRGQWRTSSDGVVKKYGRHGSYMKSSPLASMSNNNMHSVHSERLHNTGEEAIPITMQSNADFSSVHPKVKKKQSGFNLRSLGAALKPRGKGKYDMQSRQAPESPSEPTVDFPDEQRYRQLLLGEPRERSLSETLPARYNVRGNLTVDDNRGRRKKSEQSKGLSPPPSLQDILRKGSGEYSITESAQI